MFVSLLCYRFARFLRFLSKNINLPPVLDAHVAQTPPGSEGLRCLGELPDQALQHLLSSLEILAMAQMPRSSEAEPLRAFAVGLVRYIQEQDQLFQRQIGRA